MRSGKVVFNEVHAFENYNNYKVFVTGLGKVGQPRIGMFTSNGDVSDGPLDDFIAQGRRILSRTKRSRRAAISRSSAAWKTGAGQ